MRRRYTTQREDRRYIYVRKVYVYVRNCLPVRSLSPLGEVGRPLGEQSRPTASSRATCLARTSSPGVSSLDERRCEPSFQGSPLSFSLSLSSLGHYLAYERSDKIGRMRMELDGIYSRYPSLFPRRIIYPIGSLHEGWLTFGDSMGRAASSSFVASMIPSFTTA